MPASKILITAFEPFGLIRGVILRENATMEVLRAFESRHDDRCTGIVLPVGPKCEDALLRALDDGPAA